MLEESKWVPELPQRCALFPGNLCNDGSVERESLFIPVPFQCCGELACRVFLTHPLLLMSAVLIFDREHWFHPGRSEANATMDRECPVGCGVDAVSISPYCICLALPS